MGKPLSKAFLLKRGSCCDNGCMNCPYTPKKRMIKAESRVVHLTREEKLVMRIQDMWNQGHHSEGEIAHRTGLSHAEVEEIIQPYKDLES